MTGDIHLIKMFTYNEEIILYCSKIFIADEIECKITNAIECVTCKECNDLQNSPEKEKR